MNEMNQSDCRDRQRRKYKIRRLLWALLMLLAVAAAVFVLIRALGGGKPGPAQTEPPIQSTEPQTAPPDSTPPETQAPPPETTVPAPPEPESTRAPEPDEGWKLLLVNAEHPLPEGYAVTLKQLRNGHQVDERIYPELQQMFDDARAQGIYPFINESYRTSARQQEIMESYIARYEAEGLDHDQAVAKARTVVALPGTSEHELGLALDIIAEFDADSTATWDWLRENCWRYGFILRYPADKEALTGISYEPWHFRYVGVPAAEEIMKSGLCLEEYLAVRENSY